MVYTKTNGRICMSVFQRRSIFKPILTQKSILPFPKKGNRRSEHCFGQAYDDCETIKSVCDAGVNSNWIECVEIKWVEGQCLVSQQNVIVFTFSDHDGNHMRPVTGLLNLYIIMYVVFRLFSLTPHDNNDKFFIVKLSRFRQTVKTLNVNGLAMGVLYKIMCLLWQKLFSGRSIQFILLFAKFIEALGFACRTLTALFPFLFVWHLNEIIYLAHSSKWNTYIYVCNFRRICSFVKYENCDKIE